MHKDCPTQETTIMVVKSSSGGRAPLKSSDTNRLKDYCRLLKPKNFKVNVSKIKGTSSCLDASPSKTPLKPSSISSVNKSSPTKRIDQENITPGTPEKVLQLQQTPTKLSPVIFKLSPSVSGSSPSRRSGNPSFSSVFSTPSSSSASPPLSCLSGSPNSPVLKVEDSFPPQSSPISALSNAQGPDGLLGSDSRSIVGGGLNLGGSCSKRVTSRHGPLSGQLRPPVSRRNARERNRVKQVSLGFAMLRQHVPHANRKKKLSKVETLRCAVEYIKNLQSLLQENPNPLHSSTHSSSSLQQKIPAATSFQPQTVAPSSEPFLHIQVSSQLDLQQGDSAPTFGLQKMSHLSSNFQQSSHTNSFYEDRLSLQQIPNSSSCLESQLLKVPKMEEHFQTPVYSSSIFTLPSVSFVKTQTVPFTNSLSGGLDGVSPPSEGKDILPSIVADITADYSHGFPHHKDVGDVDLMEALAWWQYNT